MIILSDAGKAAFHKILNPLMTKILGKLGKEGNVINFIKNLQKIPQVTSYLIIRNKMFSHQDQR